MSRRWKTILPVTVPTSQRFSRRMHVLKTLLNVPRTDPATGTMTRVALRPRSASGRMSTGGARAVVVRHFGDHDHVHVVGESRLRGVERFADRISCGKRLFDDRSSDEEVVRADDAPTARGLSR